METGRNRARTHLHDIEMRRYRRRQMEPEELLAANEHLAGCDKCYDVFGGDDLLENTYRFARAELTSVNQLALEHLSYARMAGYVDGQLSETAHREADDHMADCPECREEIHALEQLRDEMGSSHGDTGKAPPLWNRRVVRLSLEIAAVAAAFIAGGWFLSPNLRGRIDDLSRENIELRRANQELVQRGEHRTPDAGAAAPALSHSGTGAPIILSLKDGDRQISLDTSGALKGYDSLPSRYIGLIRNVLKTGNIPAASPLSASPARLRGASRAADQVPPFRLLSPVATSVIDDRPLLRWEPVERATSYSVAVYGSNYQEVVTVKDLEGTEWRPSRALARGATYVWQVSALKDGKEIISPGPISTEARFKVLGRSQVAEIERAQKLWSDSNLLLGILYTRMGLESEASAKFHALLESNPGSPVVQQLSRRFHEK